MSLYRVSASAVTLVNGSGAHFQASWQAPFSLNSIITRMHYSRMRTARLLTVSQHALGRGGVCQHVLERGMYPSMHWAGGCVYPSMHWAGGVSALPGGVCRGMSAQRGICPEGGLPGVCVCGRHPPCEQND